jgi:hypothetical protein
MRLTTGLINLDGTILRSTSTDERAGNDVLLVKHEGDGKYLVTFVEPFDGIPAVVATQVSAPGKNGYETLGLNTCSVGGLTERFVYFTTYGSNGRLRDCNFSFVAMEC